MESAYLALLLFFMGSVDFGFSQFKLPCCGTWTKEGWIDTSKTPALSPEAVCVNGITRMKFFQNMRMKILFKPKSRFGIVGVSACKDDSQNDCYVAEIFGLDLGRLGYSWRKHSTNEKGAKGWVPGRPGKLEQTILQQESRVTEGLWDPEGQTTYAFHVERSPLGRLEIRVDGGDAEQQNEMAFPLPKEYNSFVVASDGNAEVVGAAGCGNPRRIRFRAGQEMKLKWSPGEENALGVSFCGDRGQSKCYIFEMFGESDRRLNFWWGRHTSEEKTDNRGWVPGKEGRLPEIILKGNRGTSPFLYWSPDRKNITILLKRTAGGQLSARVEGGDPSQNNNLIFNLEPKYQYGAVEILNPNKKGASLSVLGPCFNGELFGYLGETCEMSVNLNGILASSSEGCSYPRRSRFRAGQEMKLRWSPGEENELGVSFCVDRGQSKCYILEMFGESGKTLNYYWERYSSEEKTDHAGWIPGKEDWLDKTMIRANGLNVNARWRTDRTSFTILLKRASDGKLIVEVEGGDPNQKENLTFDLESKYYYASVDIHRRGKTGATLSIIGPCFNGELYGCLSDACETSASLNGVSTSSSEVLREVWSLRPGRSRGNMTSPPIKIPAGSERLCVSVTGIASHGARITINAVPVGRDPSEGISIGELSDNGLNPPEWQNRRLVAALPPTLRTGSIKLVLTAERELGSLLILRSVELCDIQDCGVATAKGRPFIALGENTSLAEFPWHAAIYQRSDWKQICGGSLVRPDIVISAAHCVHDTKDVPVDKSAFKVAVGKFYSDFNRQEPYQQISDVVAIHVPDRYRGSKRDFEHDLAVLQVTFVFTSAVVPICLDWTQGHLPPLKTGEAGLVAGWGITESQLPSPELLFGILPYIPFSECTKVVPETFLRFITADKFCAGNINGTTVKPGDSGGGLSFLTSGRWYLRGVVSIGVPNKLTYSAFVDLNYYIDWIKNIVPAAVAA